jgi:hypothetical protein
VTLSPASGQTVSVSYATADGTAKAGTHYLAQSGSLTFTPGQVEKTVPVTVLGGVPAGQSRSFYLNLTSPVNAPLARGQGIATLVNGDLFHFRPGRAEKGPALASGRLRSST